MKCPKCGVNITSKNVIKEDEKYKCPACNEEVEFEEEVVVEEPVVEEVKEEKKEPTITKDKLLNILKFVVGLVFIGVGIIIAFNNTNNTSQYSSIMDKYDEVNGSLTRISKSDNDRYTGHYEYKYKYNTYSAISDRTYNSENDVPKNVVIQVDKNNPESYNIGEFEEPKVNNTPYIISGVLVLFGIGSCIFYGAKVVKKDEK